MKTIFSAVLNLILLIDVLPGQVIEPDNPLLKYSGRIGGIEKVCPALGWPGTSVKAAFYGSFINVTLDDPKDEKGRNYFEVIIDDKRHSVLECADGLKTYTLAKGLEKTAHTVELFKRTGYPQGNVYLVGFEIDDDGCVLGFEKRNSLRMEFYGDSITVGLALDSVKDQRDAAYINNYLSYGAVTARNFNSDYRCIAASGIGISSSWWPENMPDNYYYRADPLDSKSVWDFTKWIPDIVVVNLGQNDYWTSKNQMTEFEAVSAYTGFVAKLRGHYPQSHIILALGSMNAVDGQSPWPGYIKKAVKKLNKNDARVYGLVFPFCQIEAHPHKKHHQAMADQLTGFINKHIKPKLPSDIDYKGDIVSRHRTDWTLALLPDNQYYSDEFPGVTDLQINWLNAYRSVCNIQYVLMPGDLTAHNNRAEWRKLCKSLKRLDIPYAVVSGNHDCSIGGMAVDHSSFMTEYLMSNYLGDDKHFSGRMADDNLDNSYHLFEAGGDKWIIAGLEWGPRDTVLDWLDNLLERFADRRAIVITHAYLYNDSTRFDWKGKGNSQEDNPHNYKTKGGVNDGQEIWDKVLRKHDNVVFVFSGHDLGDGTGYLISKTDGGSKVHQILANYQWPIDKNAGGGGWIRLMHFDSDGSVNVKTFSPLYRRYDIRPEQQFKIEKF